MKVLLTILLLHLNSHLYCGESITYTITKKNGEIVTKTISIKYSSTDTLTEWESSILSIAKSFIGKKVKPGACQDYVNQVIAESIGKKVSEIKYHWSEYLEKIKLEDLRPGDVICWDRATVKDGKYLDHIAMVEKIEGGKCIS